MGPSTPPRDGGNSGSNSGRRALFDFNFDLPFSSTTPRGRTLVRGTNNQANRRDVPDRTPGGRRSRLPASSSTSSGNSAAVPTNPSIISWSLEVEVAAAQAFQRQSPRQPESQEPPRQSARRLPSPRYQPGPRTTIPVTPLPLYPGPPPPPYTSGPNHAVPTTPPPSYQSATSSSPAVPDPRSTQSGGQPPSSGPSNRRR